MSSSRVAISSSGEVDLGGLVSHLLDDVPDAIGKLMFPPRSTTDHQHHHHHHSVAKGNIPVDILDTSKELIFYLDVPGVSKSDIQVTVEEENILVVKSNGKRKRDDENGEGEEEGCKYLRLERRLPQNLMRKFRLPENCDVSKISAKCENGVLTVVVEKLPPPHLNPRPFKFLFLKKNVSVGIFIRLLAAFYVYLVRTMYVCFHCCMAVGPFCSSEWCVGTFILTVDNVLNNLLYYAVWF